MGKVVFLSLIPVTEGAFGACRYDCLPVVKAFLLDVGGGKLYSCLQFRFKAAFYLKKFYDEFKRANGQVSCSDIAKQFKCSDIKARVLLSAAEFKEKMRKKGLA